MANSVFILNEQQAYYYVVTVLLEKAVLAPYSTGYDEYYIRVTTDQKDVDGNPIPDQILTSFDPTAPFTDPINAAIANIESLVACDSVGLGSMAIGTTFVVG